ncbi:hypothetical protein ACNITO_26855, partial [Escherichia coli]
MAGTGAFIRVLKFFVKTPRGKQDQKNTNKQPNHKKNYEYKKQYYQKNNNSEDKSQKPNGGKKKST